MFRPVIVACLLVGSAPLAHAADPPLRGGYFVEQLPALAAPTKQGFDWSRCYVGGHFGQTTDRVSTHLANTPFFDAIFVSKATTNLSGPVFGGQGGCNLDLGGGFVAGVELQGTMTVLDQKNCQSQTDPEAVCMMFKKRGEVAITGRFGQTFGGATFVYGRFGFGMSKVNIKSNVNSLSYTSQALAISPRFPTQTYAPVWAQSYNLDADKTAVAPVLGIGVEHALSNNWTIRADLTTTITAESKGNLAVNKIGHVTGNPGDPLPSDYSTVTRNVNNNDVIPYKIKQLDTRFAMGANRYF
jgi:opacity protein-like surface antigen